MTVAGITIVNRESDQQGSKPPAGSSGTQGGFGNEIGQMAPDFTLNSTAGKPVHLGAYRGQRNVLIYFYEHAG